MEYSDFESLFERFAIMTTEGLSDKTVLNYLRLKTSDKLIKELEEFIRNKNG